MREKITGRLAVASVHVRLSTIVARLRHRSGIEPMTGIDVPRLDRDPRSVAAAASTDGRSAEGVGGGRIGLVAHLRTFPGCELGRDAVPSRDAEL